jgi:hypothetical protein
MQINRRYKEKKDIHKMSQRSHQETNDMINSITKSLNKQLRVHIQGPKKQK